MRSGVVHLSLNSICNSMDTKGYIRVIPKICSAIGKRIQMISVDLGC